MGIKMTFGLQPNHIKRIEEYSAYWDSIRTEEDVTLIDGWIKYDVNFWRELGKEFGWDPFTLALYYFRYVEKTKLCQEQKEDTEQKI